MHKIFYYDYNYCNKYIFIFIKVNIEADQTTEDQVPSSPRKRRTRKD